MPDYEFRVFRDGAFTALHVTSIDSDSEACARAREYLAQGPQFEWIEVRSGIRFMQKILPDGSDPAVKPLTQQ